MRPEPNIPLFLWVATAIVAHAVGGGGATEVVHRLEETLEIKSFASQVRRAAQDRIAPVEVSLYSEEETGPDLIPEQKPPEANPLDAEEAADDPLDVIPQLEPDAAKPDKTVDEEEKPPEAKDEVEKEKEKKEKEKREKALEKKKPEPKPLAKLPPLPTDAPKPPPPAPKRAVAVDQHVKDKDQAPNPDAKFTADDANHVDEETRARVTATDGGTAPAQLGGPPTGAGEEPGNSDKTKLAQADDSKGRQDELPSEQPRPPTKPAATAASSRPTTSPPLPGAQDARKAVAKQAGQKAQNARAAVDAKDGMQKTVSSSGGSFAIAKAQEARAAQKARKAQQARASRRAQSAQTAGPSLGLGSTKRTANGVNLNLSFNNAAQIVSPERLAVLKKKNGERRRSEHRGKWTSMGLEKWKPALENYVASVKPGNQTALNTAASPFGSYLNKLHNRLHTIFAHKFLGHLDQLPQDHPLNNHDMSTHLEIALSSEDGRIVRMGITKSSGVTAFDVGALESVQKASPYGAPPAAIVSGDGNVYLHWEFHRKPNYACSTYFARPYILDNKQKSAPPRVTPKVRPPNERDDKKREQRHGAADPKPQPSSSPRSG